MNTALFSKLKSVFPLRLTPIVILLLSFAFLIAPLVNAQSYNQYPSVDNTVELNSYTKTQIKLIEGSAAFICLIANVNVLDTNTPCLALDPANRNITYAPNSQSEIQPGGLLGFQSEMISYMYIPPASSKQEIRYLADNFGLTKKTLAQEPKDVGQGFVGLEPVRQLYLLTRNIVYVLVIALFIVIGMAIMLRVKIDARTVMSIQNQIPKIVIGMVLITFTYAIAGLLIDVMWATTYLGVNLIGTTPSCAEGAAPMSGKATERILDTPFGFADDMLGSFNLSETLHIDEGDDCFGSLGGLPGLAWEVGKTVGGIVGGFVNAILGGSAGDQSCSGSGWFSSVKSFVTNTGECVRLGIFGAVKWFVSILALLVITISLVITLFRIWFTLLRAYVSIMIAIILSPFWILANLVPGGGFGFMQWLRHMIAHLAIFPITVFLIMFASLLTSNNSSQNASVNTFLPPLIGNPNISDNIGVIAGFAVLMFIPSALDAVRDALKTPQGKYTGSIISNASRGNPTRSLEKVGLMSHGLSTMRSAPGISKIPGLGNKSGSGH